MLGLSSMKQAIKSGELKYRAFNVYESVESKKDRPIGFWMCVTFAVLMFFAMFIGGLFGLYKFIF